MGWHETTVYKEFVAFMHTSNLFDFEKKGIVEYIPGRSEANVWYRTAVAGDDGARMAAFVVVEFGEEYGRASLHLEGPNHVTKALWHSVDWDSVVGAVRAGRNFTLWLDIQELELVE